MNPVQVSVVIPAFNRAGTVASTLSSVLDQAGPSFEVVVVDDGSHDDTAARATEAAGGDGRVNVVRQTNRGVCAARNRGAAASTGELLLFLDCDDRAEPGWLATMAELARTHPVASCGATYVDHAGGERSEEPFALGPVFGGMTALMLAGTMGIHRPVFEAVGGFAEPLRYSENTELGLRLGIWLDRHGGTAGHTPARLVRLHDPGGGTERAGSNALSPENRYHSARYMLDHHRRRLALEPRLAGIYWSVLAVSACQTGRGAEAPRHLARAALADPRQPRHLARLAASLLPPLRRRLWG